MTEGAATPPEVRNASPKSLDWPIDHRDGTRARDWLELEWGVILALMVAAVVYAWLLPNAGFICSEQPLYLLSTLAQSLAAVVALVVSVPFAIAASSRFLFGAVPLASKTPVFTGFVLFQIINIAAALLLLRARPIPHDLLDLTLCTTVAALVSLVPYVRWLVQRLDPRNHIDIVFGHCVDVIRSKRVPVTQEKVEKLLQPAVNVAVDAVSAGSVALVRLVSRRLWELYVDHNQEQETVWASKAEEGLSTLLSAFPVHPNGASEVMGTAWFVFERAYRGGRPVSYRVARGVAELTLPVKEADTGCSLHAHGALMALWLLGGLTVLSGGKSNAALDVLAKSVAAWEVRSSDRKSLHEDTHKMTAMWYQRGGFPDSLSMLKALEEFGQTVATLNKAPVTNGGPPTGC